MNNITIDMAATSETINSNTILQLYKHIKMLKFIEKKSN